MLSASPANRRSLSRLASVALVVLAVALAGGKGLPASAQEQLPCAEPFTASGEGLKGGLKSVCPGVCGDSVCDYASESCSSCPQDCGSCTYCGDYSCNGGETCSSCSWDCGQCPGWSSCTNQVPAMTSATAPSGQVTRSGVYDSGYEGWKTFDSSPTSLWISQVGQTPAWVAYAATSPRYVNKYSITYANGSILTRAPRNWQLQGWNGSSWSTIDNRVSQRGWLGLETRSYLVTIPASYTSYRLYVTEDNDDRTDMPGIVALSLGRLTLESCSDTTFCGSGMLCDSEAQCDRMCDSGNPNSSGGQCQNGCCYCY
jgi:hypothetical protein